jgi:hypothetical protein
VSPGRLAGAAHALFCRYIPLWVIFLAIVIWVLYDYSNYYPLGVSHPAPAALQDPEEMAVQCAAIKLQNEV